MAGTNPNPHMGQGTGLARCQDMVGGFAGAVGGIVKGGIGDIAQQLLNARRRDGSQEIAPGEGETPSQRPLARGGSQRGWEMLRGGPRTWTKRVTNRNTAVKLTEKVRSLMRGAPTRALAGTREACGERLRVGRGTQPKRPIKWFTLLLRRLCVQALQDKALKRALREAAVRQSLIARRGSALTSSLAEQSSFFSSGEESASAHSADSRTSRCVAGLGAGWACPAPGCPPRPRAQDTTPAVSTSDGRPSSCRKSKGGVSSCDA